MQRLLHRYRCFLICIVHKETKGVNINFFSLCVTLSRPSAVFGWGIESVSMLLSQVYSVCRRIHHVDVWLVGGPYRLSRASCT